MFAALSQSSRVYGLFAQLIFSLLALMGSTDQVSIGYFEPLTSSRHSARCP